MPLAALWPHLDMPHVARRKGLPLSVSGGLRLHQLVPHVAQLGRQQLPLGQGLVGSNLRRNGPPQQSKECVDPRPGPT